LLSLTDLAFLGRVGKDTTWTVENVIFDDEVSVAPEEDVPAGIFFKPDGTKFYICETGASKRVHQYGMTTAWDVSTATYDSKFKAITDPLATGVFLKSDGTKMFILGNNNDLIYYFTLSVAWDVSTASQNGTFSVATQTTSPAGIYVRDDGLKCYIASTSNKTVYQYLLTSSWNGGTLAYDNKSFNTGASPSFTSFLSGVFFKDDGLRMFVIDVGDKIYQFTLSVAWDVSTAVYDGVFANIKSQGSQHGDIFIKPDGTRLYSPDAGSIEVVQEFHI